MVAFSLWTYSKIRRISGGVEGIWEIRAFPSEKWSEKCNDAHLVVGMCERVIF